MTNPLRSRVRSCIGALLVALPMLSLVPARARAQKAGPPRPTAVTFANGTVTCGESAVGQATISEPAEAGFLERGVALEFSTSRPDLVRLNQGSFDSNSLGVVLKGERTTGFVLLTDCRPVETEPVDVVVTVSLNGASRSATLRVNPLLVSAVGLTRTGIDRYTGTVTLTGKSYSNEAVLVALTSSNPAIAKVPFTVAVPLARSSVQFTVTIPLVTATATPFTITARFRRSTASASETILPTGTLAASATTTNRLAGIASKVDVSAAGSATQSGVSLASFSMSPASLMSGFPTQGQLVASGPVGPGGLAVTFRGGDPTRFISNDLSLLRLPAIVTIPEGATSITFPIGTVFTAEGRLVAISATGGGATRAASLTLAPAALRSFTIKTTFRDGRAAYTATVAAPIGHNGFTLVVASDRPDLVAVQTPVVFSARDTVQSFVIATGPTREQLTVQLTATVSVPSLPAASSPRLTTAMLLYAPRVSSLRLSTAEIVGGSPTIVTGTFTLNVPAPFNYPVSLIVNNQLIGNSHPTLELVTPPVIAAGATTGQFTLRTRAVTTTSSFALSIRGAVADGDGDATLRVTVRP